AACLADLEAVREAEEAARRAAAEAYLAKVQAGEAPPGRAPEEAAVAAAEIALDRALTVQQAKCDAYAQREAESAGRGVPGPRPAPLGQAAPVRRARERLAAARKAAAAAEAEAGPGPPGRDSTGKPKRKRDGKPPRPVRNITDPDSRAMHCTRNGTVQACNCQLPRADDGLVLVAAATQDTGDAAQVEPTLAGIAGAQEVIAAGHRAGGHSPALSVIGTIVYDAGYFSEKNCTAEGPDRLISTGSWESAESSGPHTPACQHRDPRDQMAHNLSTRQGRDIYRRRAPLSEGGFSFLKDKIGLRRFSMRGLPLAQAELTLAATVSNLMLLHRRLPGLP
ncbi:MAG TPA: transposase, partial [Streptosporangiaceae bacterium]